MKKGLLTVLASVLISGLTAYAIVRSTAPDMTPAPVTSDGASYRTVNLEQTDYPDFTYAAESAVDAVVYVAVTIKTTVQQQQYIDPLEFFFGYPGGGYNRQPQEREQRGSGSGVIIRPDGYIVTNNHVVNGATEVQVVLNNNKTYEAKVIGTDEATDVALIKIEAEGLPTIPFADSDNLRLGEWVLAIGSPYNLRSTITAGIVSAKGRSMGGTTEQQDPYGRQSQSSQPKIKIESFIQTDAAVNPGNSGGALVNKAGELVGINTAIMSQTGAYSGYSFAVPSNMVKKIVSDLIDFGNVRRALLGVTMQAIDDEIAKDLKLSSMNGVYIKEVVKGSAADKAGMKEGDVLIAIDNTPLKSMTEVQAKVNSYRPGDKAVATVIRDGKTVDFDVTFQESSDLTGTAVADGSVSFYGAMLKEASKETLDALGLKKGVEIVSIGAGKVLDAGGSQGMIILYVNDEPVSKPDDVINIAKKARRSVMVEGVTATGRVTRFVFGKD